MKLTKTKLRTLVEEVMDETIEEAGKYKPLRGEKVMARIDDEPEPVIFRRFERDGRALVRRIDPKRPSGVYVGDDPSGELIRIDPNLMMPAGPQPRKGIGDETEAETDAAYRRNPEFFNESSSEITNDRLMAIVAEELDAVLAEKKKKSAKDKMKCNSPRRIRKGEPGHGKKKFVVKACDGGTEKIIRYGDAGLKIKRKQKGRRKNFRARHNCDNPGSKLKARYWSCKNW